MGRSAREDGIDDFMRSVRDCVDALGNQLLVLDQGAGDWSPGSPLRTARRLYAQRRARDRYFPPNIFGEPGWDILLDLYIARHSGKEISTSSACQGSCTPATTGLRWLSKLADAGLITLSRTSSGDRRVTLVEISDDANSLMTEYLLRVGATLQ